MNFLNKIQNLPVKQRKIILWTIIVILGLFLFWFNVRSAQKRFRNTNSKELKKEFQIPDAGKKLKEELEKLPKFEIPKIK